MLYLCERGGDGNSQLKGKFFTLPIGIKKTLDGIVKKYADQSHHKDYHRLLNIFNSGKVEYDTLKKIKSFFDNFYGDEKTLDYQLNGGDDMRMWANMTLGSATNRIKDMKQAKKSVGMKNAFIKPHTKNRLTKNSTKVTAPKVNMNGSVIKNVANGDNIRYESKNHMKIILTNGQISLLE